MGSFWGPNDRTKTAEGWMDEYPIWLRERLKQYWNQQDEEYPISKWLRDRYNQSLQEGQDQGFGSIDDLLGFGNQIFPGMEEEYSNAKGRTKRLRDFASGMPDYNSLYDETSSIFDDYGRGITADYDNETGDIRDTFGRAMNRSDEYGKNIVGSLGDSYGAAQGATDDEFNSSFGDVGSTYAGRGQAGDAMFDKLNQDLEQFKPGSESRSARIQRSFAPALASTAMRVRRAGIDSSSPEANAMFQRVESDRARAADDAMGEDINRYVSGRQKLGLTELGRGDDMATGRMDRMLSLYGKRGDVNRGLTLGKGKEFRGELNRQLDLQNELDMRRLGANTSAGRNAGNRSDQFFGRKLALPGMKADWADKQFGREGYMADREGGDFQQYMNNRAKMFGAGSGYQGANLGRKDQFTNWMGQSANDSFRRGMGYGQMATQAGDSAMQGFGGTYARNAPKSGWGTRMLTGLAGAGLNFAMPGIGNWLTGMMSNGGSRGGGYGAGGWT